jgi:hypothetical protein
MTDFYIIDVGSETPLPPCYMADEGIARLKKIVGSTEYKNERQVDYLYPSFSI